MKYIWNEYSEDKKYILCKENIVPGVEVWGDNKDIVSVNVLVRLFDIIFPQKYVNSEEKYMELLNNYSDTDEYKDIFNVMMHLCALMDLNSGICLDDILIMYFEKKITDGSYGEYVYETYMKCPDKGKYFILNSYAEYLRSDNRENYFDQFIETYFKVINIYHQKSLNKDYIYIHVDKTEENLAVLNLAQYFLQNLDRDIEIMWKGEHIPIIGFDYSMIVENMCLG